MCVLLGKLNVYFSFQKECDQSDESDGPTSKFYVSSSLLNQSVLFTDFLLNQSRMILKISSKFFKYVRVVKMSVPESGGITIPIGPASSSPGNKLASTDRYTRVGSFSNSGTD